MRPCGVVIEEHMYLWHGVPLYGTARGKWLHGTGEISLDVPAL
jgi:hypothetical protein